MQDASSPLPASAASAPTGAGADPDITSASPSTSPADITGGPGAAAGSLIADGGSTSSKEPTARQALVQTVSEQEKTLNHIANAVAHHASSIGEQSTAIAALNARVDTIQGHPADLDAPANNAVGSLVSASASIPESFLRSLLGDGLGNLSSLRAVFVFATLIIVSAWAIVSIRAGALQPLPPGVVTALAVLTGGKLWQNGQENSTDSNAQP